MAKESVDFHKFGDELWNIANVLRADIVKVTEYLEEFSYFLFLKLLDDMERQDEEVANLSGKEYISLIPSNYRFYNWADDPANWAKIHGYDSVINFLNRMSVDLSSIKDEIDAEGSVIQDRSLIRKVFQNHILRLRYDKTVIMLTKRLRELELESANYDVAGRAYEYLIQKLGEQGQYGQYFTPRHVVDFMVKLIEPEIGDKIYDPAAGTGGFLIWAYEHVIRNHIDKIPDAARQEIEIRKLKRNIFGTEKAPDVFKLGLMNLVLHRVDGSANFEEGDSLSAPAQGAHRNKYDVILTNPPFGPLVYEPSGVFEYPTKFFEASFLQHMMNALKPGGRCATVMKEGLLFSNTPGSLVKIRKRLVDEFNLIGVISMPSGVFLPYTGSKTSILVFEKPAHADAPKTEAVWFYRVDDDGFELGATRRPLSEEAARGELAGDLPDALAKFRGREESEKSWLVTVEKIRENDYNLTANRYAPYKAEETEMEKPEVLIEQLIGIESEIQEGLKDLYSKVGKGGGIGDENFRKGGEIKKMNELCEKITSGGTPLTSKMEYYNGDIPWAITEDITSSNMYIKQTKKKITKKGLDNSSAKLFPKNTLLLTMYGTVGKVAITEVEMATNQAILGLIPKKQADTLYLYYFLESFENKWQNFMRTTTQSNINATIVKGLTVPLPPLEEQKKIVEILQFADYLKERRREAIKLIDKIVMSLFYDMFGDPATNPKGWEIERLDKICNFDTYQILPDARREYFYLGLEDIESNTGKIIKNTKTLGSKILSNKHNFDNSHVLYGKLRPYLNKVAMPMQEGICSTDIIPLKPDKNYLIREFLVYYLRDKNFIKWATEHSTGTKMPRIQTSALKKHQMPLPPLASQQEFAEIVSKLEDKRKKMEEAEEKLEMLYQILLKQAFTGKLTEEWRMKGKASKSS